MPKSQRANKPLHIRIYRRITRDAVATVMPWVMAAYMVLLKLTCRVRFHNDPRPLLKANGHPYVFSVLHAQQLAAATCGNPGIAAMVSQSRDGGAVALGLRAVGIIPIRGSSRHKGKDKGGLAALFALIDHVRSGKPAFLAVDGPRGPRNQAQKGIAVLSQKSGAVVINAVCLPSRRWIIKRSWDRFQIPMPFCRVDCYFAAPMQPIKGESAEDFRLRIETALNQHEALRDPQEAVCGGSGHLNVLYADSPATKAA